MRRLLVYVCTVVLVETMLGSSIAPLLPDLRDELGLAKWEAGVLVGAYALGVVALSLPSAILSSRLGAKTTVVIGLLALGVASLAFGLLDEVWLLNLSRFVQGGGAALCWTAGLAWLVAATPAERRGELIGIAIGIALVGALLGPVIGGAAAAFSRAAVYGGVAALTGLLALAALAIGSAPRFADQPLRMLFHAVRDQTIATGLWMLALPALLVGTILVLGPLRLEESGWGVLGITMTFVFAAALEAIVNPVAGKLSDRLGRLPILRAGLAAAAASALVLPFVDNRWAVSAVIGAAAIAYSLFWAPSIALVMDRAESLGLSHTLSLALANLAFAPGALVGSVVAGALSASLGDVAPFALVAALCLLTFGVLGRLKVVEDDKAAADYSAPSM